MSLTYASSCGTCFAPCAAAPVRNRIAQDLVVDRWLILETFVSFDHAVCAGAEDIVLAVLSRYSTRWLVEFFERAFGVCVARRGSMEST
jgi:hypothetical protein